MLDDIYIDEIKASVDEAKKKKKKKKKRSTSEKSIPRITQPFATFAAG